MDQMKISNLSNIAPWFVVAILTMVTLILLFKEPIKGENNESRLVYMLDSIDARKTFFEFKATELEKKVKILEDSNLFIKQYYDKKIDSIKYYTVHQLDSAISAAIFNYGKKSNKRR